MIGFLSYLSANHRSGKKCYVYNRIFVLYVEMIIANIAYRTIAMLHPGLYRSMMVHTNLNLARYDFLRVLALYTYLFTPDKFQIVH